MSTPEDAGAVGASVMKADPHSLPMLAAHWRALLPAIPAAPPVPAYPDPASSAVASAMADWPTIQEDRTTQRTAEAEKFVAAVDKTAKAFAATDYGAANAISSSVGPTLV